MSRTLHGLGVSPGIAVGTVVLLRQTAEPVIPVAVPPERLEDEIARFDDARAQARREIEDIRDRTLDALGESYAGILDAQLLILVDPKLVANTIQRIRVGRVSASWALKESVREFMRKFHALDDGYIRERGGDLEDVHHRLQRILRGEHPGRQDLPGEGPHIVVAHTLGPSDSVFLARQNIAAFATDVGGPTSHTAILAQAISVPAVVGLHDITQGVYSGDPIILDGSAGTVVLDSSEEQRTEARRRQREIAERDEGVAIDRTAPLRTRDGVEVTVQANVEFPQEVDKAIRYGAQGIGLYRSEFLFLARSPDLPTEDEHYETYRDMAARMSPSPVTVRTLDLGGEKYFHEVLDADESNPVLGLRAVRFCLTRPDIFRPQLRGLLRAAAEHPSMRMMIPLVTTTAEIREVRRMLAEEAEELQAAGVPCRPDIQVGIMIEVPAAAVAADLLAREADFFSVGTNDLIQYALAVDRSNESVSYLYEPLHPAVLRMLKSTVDGAARQGIPVSLCGEMAADPALIDMLLGMGLREMSVQPRAVESIRRAVEATDSADARLRFAEALELETADAVVRFYRAEKVDSTGG